MFKIPELLAPAGGMEQLKAAVETGALVLSLAGFRIHCTVKKMEQ